MQEDTRQAAALFAGLYYRHERGIRAHVQEMVREADAADDLVQETFLRAWRGLSTLRDPAAARTWLYRIATNCVLNHIRRARLRTTVPLVFAASDDEEDDEAVPGWMADGSRPSPPEELADKEQLRALDRAVGELPAGKRQVVQLVYTRGFSVSEAARVLGLPEGTVKSRLHYALREIEGYLKRMEES